MAMKVLITGGAGYIGSVLTPALLADGHEVTVLDNFLFRQCTLTDCCGYDSFSVVRGDCRDPALLKPLIARSDLILPLAALVGAPMCDRDRVGAESTNLEAIRLLCRLAGRDQWILYPTTNSGYGIGLEGQPCTEESPLRPVSLYGSTKVQAEEVVLERDNSLSYRLATVFGMSPRMRLDLLVNDFVHRAMHDRALVLFESHFKRNYIHIRDVVRAVQHGIQQFDTMRGRPYNVGLDDANLSKAELCALIQQFLPGFVWFDAPIGEDPDKRDYIVSNARLLATGFRTEWPLDRGVRELIKGFTILRGGLYANV
jgi:nucleoside-diphosphate-sugar epimerase